MRPETLLNLDDSAQATGNSLAKAQVLCQELCENYFQYGEGSYLITETGQAFIYWEYRRYALYAHIIQDYILRAEAELSVLSDLIRDALGQPDENS